MWSSSDSLREHREDSTIVRAGLNWEDRSGGLVRGAPGHHVRAARTGGRGHGAGRSAAGYVDGDGDGVADDVPDGRVAGEGSQLGELVVVEVAGDLDGDPDLLVAGADIA